MLFCSSFTLYDLRCLSCSCDHCESNYSYCFMMSSILGLKHTFLQDFPSLTSSSLPGWSHDSVIVCCFEVFGNSAIKSQNTVKPNPLCRLPVTSPTSRDVPFSPNSITPTSLDGKFRGTSPREVGVMEFGLKRDVTACRGRHGKSA